MTVNINATEKKFISSVAPIAQQIMRTNKILSSVTIAQAALESSWGNSLLAKKANNLFSLNDINEWNGTVYSTKTKESYDSKSDAFGISSLYRSYDNINDSLQDRTHYLLTLKDNSNKYKYRKLTEITDYKEACELFEKNKYSDDKSYSKKLIDIIEKYELLSFDEAVNSEMAIIGKNIYKIRKSWDKPSSQIVSLADLDAAKDLAKSNAGYKVFNYSGDLIYDPNEDGDELFRVRLEWNRPETQLFASKNFEAAKNKASLHNGYKVFGDDGSIKYPLENDLSKNENINHVIIPIKGAIVNLNNIGIYKLSTDKNPFIFISGTYYFYEDKIYNNMVRISYTSNPTDKNIKSIIGFVRLSDL